MNIENILKIKGCLLFVLFMYNSITNHNLNQWHGGLD